MRWGFFAKQPSLGNPFRFLITPTANANVDLYYDLSLAPAGFWSHVRSDGGDIRVTTQAGAPVAREVSGFDYAGNKGSLFFSTSGGTAFYVTYGNAAFAEPAANSTYGKYAVWESAARFVAHLEDYTDSTAQQSALTQNDSTIVDAKLGKGGHFVAVQHGAGITTDYDEVLSDFTFAAWFFSTGQGNCTYSRIVDKAYDTGCILARNNADANTWGCWLLNTPYMVTLAEGAWHLLCVTRSGTSLVVNGDGGSVTNPQTVAATALDTTILRIGFDNHGYLSNFGGLIDEVRIYSRALSATEIAVMYANQNAPATFWTTGAEE